MHLIRNTQIFLEVTSNAEYCTHKERKMYPEYFVAMSDDANLVVGQQRVKNKPITHHLGHIVRTKKIAAIKKKYIGYEVTYIKIDEQNVLYSYRDLSTLIKHKYV